MTAADFLRFLACWQHVDEEHRLEGPRGVAEVVAPARGLRGAGGGVGGERPARARPRLPARVARRAHALGRGRLGAPLGQRRRAPIRTTPLCLVPRDDLDAWMSLSQAARRGSALGGAARAIHGALVDARGDVSAGARARVAPLALRARKGARRARRARASSPATRSAALRSLLVPSVASRGAGCRSPGAGACSVTTSGRGRSASRSSRASSSRARASSSAGPSQREKQPVPVARSRARAAHARGARRGPRRPLRGRLRRRAIRAARSRLAPARRAPARPRPAAPRRRGRPAELPRNLDARRTSLAARKAEGARRLGISQAENRRLFWISSLNWSR